MRVYFLMYQYYDIKSKADRSPKTLLESSKTVAGAHVEDAINTLRGSLKEAVDLKVIRADFVTYVDLV